MRGAPMESKGSAKCRSRNLPLSVGGFLVGSGSFEGQSNMFVSSLASVSVQ